MKFDENPALVDWGPAGIYFAAAQKTARHLFRADPDGGAVERITGPDPYIAGEFSFTRDFSHMTFACALPDQFTEIEISDVKSFAPRQLTAVSDQYKKFHLASREVIEWRSSDETPIEGILIKPADYEPAQVSAAGSDPRRTNRGRHADAGRTDIIRSSVRRQGALC